MIPPDDKLFVGDYERTKLQHLVALCSIPESENRKEYLERIPSEQRAEIKEIFPDADAAKEEEETA